jgi:hypothetical protein
MGVTKKPSVKAKTARKVRISATEAAFAKSQGVSLEDLAKSKLPKRGRPKGSKNKPKVPSFPIPVGAIAVTWEQMENDNSVDWERLAKQLQEALAKEMKLNEVYEKAGFFDRLVYLFTGKF